MAFYDLHTRITETTIDQAYKNLFYERRRKGQHLHLPQREGKSTHTIAGSSFR